MGTYNKLKMRKFGPCKIVNKHDSSNAYEVEMPKGFNISPIFNVSDLTKYYEGEFQGNITKAQFSVPESTSESCEIETTLDSKVSKSTRIKEYFEYFIKWLGRPIEDSSCLLVIRS